MPGNGPWDPMEGDTDWGYTGYGTGDPNANGFLDKLGRAMPWIVGGGMAAGTLAPLFSAAPVAAAPATGALAPTVPGSVASTAYAAGAFTAPSATTAAATGGMMASPLARYGLPAVGDFLTSMFSSSRDAKENQKQRDFLAQQGDLNRALDRENSIRNVAADESKLDPWRNQVSQVGDASKLDRFANSTYTPVTVSRGPGGNIQTSGGATYNKSPELIAAARAAAQLILSGGGQAPTMTDPANYGQTGATDLTGGAGRPQMTTGGSPMRLVGPDGRPIPDTRPRMRTPGGYLGTADDPWAA